MRLKSVSNSIQRVPDLWAAVGASHVVTRCWPSQPPTQLMPARPADPCCTVAPAQQKGACTRTSSCGQNSQQRVLQRRADLPVCTLVIASKPEAQDTSQAPTHAPLRLKAMNRRLLELNPQHHALTTRLFLEDRDALPQEQRALDQRNELLAQRNRLRDLQLHALLAALSPLQRVRAQGAARGTAPLTDSQARIRHDDAYTPGQETSTQSTCLAQAYRDALEQLDILQDSAAPCALIQQLHCLMHDYRTLTLQRRLGEAITQRERSD
ncbi:hypothetical protein [Xanthomonas nasturtii]|uniref:hypothetical protein n=1 Tax=Xanthomonas nasturtii TaxID=1843581 RepID=UPI00201320E5|nr:hypothetical protein [Xanthomonas nasturtii]MCL1526131.1 hypothetical protein [Xanthomonas nasturtii]MCL1535108.1 hypothetical protein [Xanthomonas nasturtii]MCL1543361.1 hypothetical protein [Xanthomonas nasturtii]